MYECKYMKMDWTGSEWKKQRDGLSGREWREGGRNKGTTRELEGMEVGYIRYQYTASMH
jgi:hypothetical protein